MPWKLESADEPLLGSASRLKVATTSSAVIAWPLLNVTFWRSLNVHVLAVASGVQLSARTGRSDKSFSTQARYSHTCWTVAMAPASYMTTGSRAPVGGTMATRMVPPVFGATLADADAVDVDVEEPPQAASSEPMVVMERPRTVPRTSSSRRVIRPFFTCSTRSWPSSRCNSFSCMPQSPLFTCPTRPRRRSRALNRLGHYPPGFPCLQR